MELPPLGEAQTLGNVQRSEKPIHFFHFRKTNIQTQEDFSMRGTEQAIPAWPGWETVRLIGRGSFGGVNVRLCRHRGGKRGHEEGEHCRLCFGEHRGSFNGGFFCGEHRGNSDAVSSCHRSVSG